MKLSINLQKGTLEKEADSGIIIGIDLGTTNSLVAHIHDGRAVAIRDKEQGTTLLPSVLYFQSDEHYLVGQEAKAFLQSEPERCIFSVKRLLGKSYQDIRDYEGFLGYDILDDNSEEALVKVRVGKRFYNPIELSAKILAELKERIENYLNQKVSKAVISVPAYFNDIQRQATRDAGRLAGLDVLRIINEPTAASLAYGLGMDEDEEKTVAVYDLGGGTFDISILRIEGGVFEVLSTTGDTFLGGDDFDRLICQHWLAQAGKEENRAAIAELRPWAEEAKKALSKQELYENEQAKLKLSRQDFDKLIAGHIERSLSCCRRALADAKLEVQDIDELVLVGGSTRVPAVRKSVEGFFARSAKEGINPDEVVALGAAVQANILAGKQKGMLLLDVTPLSLGIETMGGLMDVIIPRNSKVPTRVGRQYTSSVDGQVRLKVSVFQGERDLVADNDKLGEFVLENIPPMPAGIPKIEIHFLLNADGILKVRAKELRSGTEQTVTVRSPYSLSEEDMGRMLLDSIRHAKEDMQQRALIEARTEAKGVLQASEKFLAQNKELFSEEALQGLRKLAQALETSCQSDDKDAIRQAMQELNDYAAPLAQEAMDKSISQAMQGHKIID